MFKLITRFLRSIGIFVIVLVTFATISLGFLGRTMQEGTNVKKLLDVLNWPDLFAYDLRSKLHIDKNPKNINTVLIEIDDQSLQKLQRWPIPRDYWATMLDNLGDYDARVVAFDAIFPEPVQACGEESPDDVFARAVTKFNSKEGSSIIMAYTVQDENTATEFLPTAPLELMESMIPSQVSPNCKAFSHSRIEKHNWPIDKLVETESEMGYLNNKEDFDGVFRHYTVYASVYSEDMESYLLLPSLGFRAFMSSNETNDLSVNIQSDCSGSVDINGKNINFNSSGETKLRWTGLGEKFESIPLYRVIEGKDYTNDAGEEIILKDFFKDQIVFIGSTATGAHDFRNTPVDAKTPGVYAHINLVDMMKRQYFYKPIEETIKISLIGFSIAITLLMIIMFFNKAILDIFGMAILIYAMWYIDYKYFYMLGYELKLASATFGLVVSYFWITFLNFNQASAEKEQIKGAFSRYVAPSIVDDMLDNPEKLKIGGEKRDITCMFSDVRDFTSISEKLTPTELATSLNRYMGEMTDIVFATNGTLDKYIGDAIVAFWGAPLDIGDHVTQAVEAGVLMMEALPAINKEFKDKGLPKFKIGLGLNSGECSVGNMGSDAIFAYTALGDNMNLGARLESLCKHYGAQILISEYTYQKMDQSKFTCRIIDKVRVKGKSLPVAVYEVLYSYHDFMVDQDALNNFRKAYDLYLEGKFEDAKTLFEGILEVHHNDAASLRLQASCVHWIENPPKEGEDWTITTMTSK